MIRLISILLVSLCSIKSYGQPVIAVENHYGDIMYLCNWNSITVAMESTSCNDIFIETNNGVVRKDSLNRGSYQVCPDKVGLATITIKRKKRKHDVILGQREYQVKRLDVLYGFGSKKGGELSTIDIREGVGLGAVMSGGGICGGYIIDSFTIAVVREGKEIFKRRLSDKNGARFDYTTKNFLATVKQRDKIFFTGIRYRDLCRQSVKLDDMEFTISNAHEKRPAHGQQVWEDPITGQTIIKKW